MSGALFISESTSIVSSLGAEVGTGAAMVKLCRIFGYCGLVNNSFKDSGESQRWTRAYGNVVDVLDQGFGYAGGIREERVGTSGNVLGLEVRRMTYEEADSQLDELSVPREVLLRIWAT